MGALVGAIDSSAGNSSSSWTAKSADADLEGGPLLGAIALLGVNSPSSCLPTPRSGCRYTTSFLVENFSPHHKILSGEFKEVIRQVSSDSTIIPNAIREIEDSVTEAGDIIRALYLEQVEIGRETGDAVEGLGIKFDQLSMEIGPREELPEEYQAPTLWGLFLP